MTAIRPAVGKDDRLRPAKFSRLVGSYYRTRCECGLAAKFGKRKRRPHNGGHAKSP